ncbi:MAG: hypothetical protein A2X52_12230 [Candidatus Rokubacteria bacterium GWC2_70_16]|nr:MAG: hypothetical protein A2X52_12230 [Candidatus Rokubacteria bacterium GWC2_70_16]OGL13715.1 MAG: hypothetical protein A3K12_08855 [Candidatus Rokubacteria bacterium RIFCSPLOWO2_12_FULL_71_19]
MRHLRLSTVRSRLICLVLVAMFPALALAVYEGLTGSREAASRARDEALRIARLVAHEEAGRLEGARQFLVALARIPAVRSLDGPASTRLFQDLLKRFPQYANLSVAAPDGSVFATAAPPAVQTRIADRDYFRRALETRDCVLSGYLIGRATGRPVIVLACPSLDEDGAVRAMVLASLDLARLGQVAAAAHMPEGSVIQMMDNQGVVIASHPDSSQVGQALSHAPGAKTALPGRAEGTASAVGLDGVQRYYAFTPLLVATVAGEIHVAVGIPTAAVLAVARRTLAWHLGALLALMVLALWATRFFGEKFLARPLRGLLEAVKRVGGGDLSARAGFRRETGEIAALAQAFDDMAAALEQRTRALDETETRYRALVEQSLAGVYVTDAERFLFVNQAAADILDHTVEELVGGLGPMDMVHPDDRERVAGNIRARLEGALEALRYSFRCVRKDGTVIDCEVFGRRASYEGQPAILGTLIDVTERGRTERELRRLNRALQAIVLCNMALVRSQDETRLLGEVCRVIVETAGYPMAWVGLAEEDEARSIRPVARVGGDARHLASMTATWAETEEGDGPVGIAIRTGRPAIASSASTDPALAAWREEAARVGHASQIALPLAVEGRILGVLGICGLEPDAFDTQEVALLTQLADDLAFGMSAQRARAERERMKEQIESQREAAFHREKLAEMGSLLAGVAHELNNPLAVLIGRLSLLRMKPEAEPLAQGLGKLSEAADRCVRIVRNFLALARQRPPERGEVSLNQVIREAVELLAYPLRVDNVAVQLALAEDLPRLWADPHQLHQVVVNLITNGHHAMRGSQGPRRLTFTTRSDPARKRVCLEVADTGPGVPPDLLRRIFEPFFTTKPVGQGTGLGLAMCQGIVEGHGGSIRVESAPGAGATFVVELPVEGPGPLAPEASPLPEARRIQGRTILVVEDEPEVAQLLADVLEADGHLVDTAADGAAALARLSERSYDMVLSDLRMPTLDGPGLYGELERRHPELTRRIAFVTGDALSPRTREFLEATGAPCLEKPFRPEDVRRIVSRILLGGAGAGS